MVREETPTELEVVHALRTRPGARTMELDPETHRLYTVTGRFGPAAAAGERLRRPPVIPGSFMLLVLYR